MVEIYDCVVKLYPICVLVSAFIIKLSKNMGSLICHEMLLCFFKRQTDMTTGVTNISFSVFVVSTI
jgi:hypothetical protein